MSKSSIKTLLTILFFLVSCVEICAEYYKNIEIQWLTKPFLMPILMALYVVSCRKISYWYMMALFFNWLANVFFIFVNPIFMFLAVVSFMMYRMVIILKLFKEEKELGLLPIILGSIPFLFLFVSLINMVFENIHGIELYLSLIQSVLMTLLGGFSLANFVIKNTYSSKFLLVSSLFFGINLFTIGIKYYFIDLVFLKPIAMIFLVSGHYLFYHFVIKNEKS